MFPSRALKISLIVIVTLAIAGAASALAAANTVPASHAGDGANTVAGYTVSAIHYTLNAATPTNVDQISFTLSVAPVAGSSIRVRLYDAGPWYTCTNAGTAVTCNTTSPQATASTAANLTVVIAD
jgi:hypothetical protein